jgi:peptidyl-prolyl cis-trans isomerase C
MNSCRIISPQLFYFKAWLALVISMTFLAACSQESPSLTPSQTASAKVNTSPSPGATETTQAPTSTPEALAAQINATGIPLTEYQAELMRYQQATGRELNKDDRQRVLDELINQTLLAQAATEKGFTLDETALQTRMDNLAKQIGGDEALAQWMKTNGYIEADFRLQLAQSASAAWMRDQILVEVPTTAEQVHARQILSRTAEEANQILAKLQAGEDFTTLAKQTDPVSGGDLGWFPRGYLFFPALDEAAFSLESGKYSGVIETTSGFHILSVIERDPQRPLDPQALLFSKEKALQRWLEERRQQSKIEIISP